MKYICIFDMRGGRRGVIIW